MLGKTCDDTSQVGGHYYTGMTTDPWTGKGYSGGVGASEFELNDGYSLQDQVGVCAATLLGYLKGVLYRSCNSCARFEYRWHTDRVWDLQGTRHL